jgi:hypothetical protein
LEASSFWCARDFFIFECTEWEKQALNHHKSGAVASRLKTPVGKKQFRLEKAFKSERMATRVVYKASSLL